MTTITITDLPIELLIDSLLPALALRDLLNLACTNKFFAAVCADDTFWRRKTTLEYNFSGAESARTSGFRNVYRGLRRPRVFVWGETSHSRLALTKSKHGVDENAQWDGVDYPVELDLGSRRVVHLAAGGWSFHALTDDGQVLVWGSLDSQAGGMGSDDLGQSGTTVDQPVALIFPQKIKALRFCDVTHVRNEPGFRQDQGHEDSQRALEDLTVTHISAQFRTFVVYSTTGSSVVLLGKADTTRQGAPKIVPELQNCNVISVVLGDYHYCALTANGELFSWGKYSNGALGLGRPRQRQQRGSRFQARHAGIPLLHQPMMPMLHQPARSPERRDVDKPTCVSFDHEDHIRDRYVFAVAAAGWHCGALVIDLHSSTSASDEGTPEAVLGADEPTRTSEPSASTSTSQPIAQLPRRTEGESGETHPPQITLPIVRGRAPFRLGGAARGAYTGRAAHFPASDPGSDAHDGANPGRAD
ncbi:hypothetical protein FRC09_004147 [Ceratobasidium sp. 395]|nr:hypothetical protein FRC09_004147 [Ceratobasidium sp. 395]